MTRSPRRRMRLILGSALACCLGLILSLTTPTPADAATNGRMLNLGGWQVGSFLSSRGGYVYCLDPGGAVPSAAQQAPTRMSSLPGYSLRHFDPTGWDGPVSSGTVSGERLRQINYVLHTWGNTTSAAKAAAVQLAIWKIHAEPGAKAWVDHHFAWARNHGGASQVTDAEAMVAEAKRNAKAAAKPTPGAVRLEYDDERGSGRVTVPAGVTGIQISGGTFANGETAAALGGAATELEWRPTLHAAGWAAQHGVRITADWQARVPDWPAQVLVHGATAPLQQRLGAGIAPTTRQYNEQLTATLDINTTFHPVVTSQVPEAELTVDVDHFSDTVTLDVAPESDPWPQVIRDADSEYAPLLLEGVVYGPFEVAPERSETPPEGTPVAARVTLLADAGPGSYEIASTERPAEPGYYTWVWSIRAAAQPEDSGVQALLPEGYTFSDDFGVAEETQYAVAPPAEVVPSTPAAPPTPEEVSVPRLSDTGGPGLGGAAPVIVTHLIGGGVSVVLLTAVLRQRRRNLQRLCSSHLSVS